MTPLKILRARLTADVVLDLILMKKPHSTVDSSGLAALHRGSAESFGYDP